MAALTVPIIKDGYRLYPGMPVSGNGRTGGSSKRSSVDEKSQRTRTANGVLIAHGRLSPPDSVSASGSPPKNGLLNRGSPHQVLLQPRIRTTSNQSEMSARSSFDVAPNNYRPDLMRGRSAMSTSQLYMQQRRELAIQQQLRKQQLQQQQQQLGKNGKSSSHTPPPLAQRSDSNGNESCATDYDAEDSLNFCGDHRSRRTSSSGDHNNNKDSNPLRKFLKRLGLGNSNCDSPPNHRSPSNSFSESSIEQAIPALQGLSVPARQ